MNSVLVRLVLWWLKIHTQKSHRPRPDSIIYSWCNFEQVFIIHKMEKVMCVCEIRIKRSTY